jgi:osmotically-inducible protein OsmY
MRRVYAAGAWLLVLLFVMAGALAQDKPASPDAAITASVRNAFANDRTFRSMDIHVETQDAVVSLSGYVRSVEDIARAGDLAREVNGVAAVRNGLRVSNRPSRA